MVETLHSIEFPNGFLEVIKEGDDLVIQSWSPDGMVVFFANRAEVQDLVTIMSDWLKGEFDD